MYDHLHPHNTEHRWGRYWRDAAAAQRIPLTDPGRPFRFAYAETNATMAEMTGNLEVAENTITITTKYDYKWSCDGAISIDGKLYKIQDGITSQMVADKTYGLAKGLVRRYTIRLMEIPNPAGVR
jgi:hypothetical protein